LKVLPKLNELYLVSNEISEIISGEIGNNGFLEYLYLDNNKIEHLGIDVFYGLINLKYIHLQGNNLHYIHPDTFVGLPNLQQLILSKNSGLQIPTDRHFINSLSLKVLAILGCNISSVSVETFAKLSELEVLDMSYNYLRSLDINILKVLPKLSKLLLESNEINEIISGETGNKVFLEYLNLDNNKIEYLGIDVFYGLINLKYIYLKGNNLHYIHPDTFAGLPKLQQLILSKNSGLQIQTDRHFINSLSLKELAISGCNISSVSVETFANVSEIESLDLSHNYLRSLDINILKVLPKLNELYLVSNEIYEIISGEIGNNSFMEYLVLENNKIEHLGIDVFYGLINLQYIYLQGNNLHYIHPDTFTGLPNLQHLTLSGNSGLQVPTGRHFINSLSLKELGIAGCNLRSVSVETFANVSELEQLDLSYNILKSLDIRILKALPQLSKLYLYGNPLQCDRQLQEVWRWCKDHNIQTDNGLIVPGCDTPNEVKRMWWGVLEKGQCGQGNIHYGGDYNDTRYSYTPIADTYTYTDADTDTDTKTEQRTEMLMWIEVARFFQHYRLPIYAILFIFGTTGNVILIIIITCNKDMRTLPNMYILNLAISDIIYLTVLFFAALANSAKIVESYILCLFFPFFFQMSVGLSVYSIAVLSFQRYKVIVYPLNVRSSSQRAWRTTGATICGVWIVAALLAIPSARTKSFCNIFLILLFTKYYQRVTIFRLLVSCVLPLCVIAFFYIMTSRHLLKSNFSASEVQNARRNTRKIAAKVLLGFTVVLLFSYVPYHILYTYLEFSIRLVNSLTEFKKNLIGNSNLLDIFPSLHIFLSISSCLNPVALFFTGPAFRRHFKRYLTCCCKTKSPPTDFELTRRN
jgi:Leucine-rich repeat (LRR) protein